MIDADEQPLRQTDDQTLRIWDRVRQGMTAERRRFRRHALLSAVAGGLVGAAVLTLIVRAPWQDGSSDLPAEDCQVAMEQSLPAGCP